MAKSKKRTTFHKVLGIITDIFIYPVVILAFLSSFVMINSKRDNEVYSIFGISIVKILSGSMVAAGFEIDDLVLLRAVDTDQLREGDDIAFYRFRDDKDPTSKQLVKITDFDDLPLITSQESVVGTKTKKDASKEQSPVIFHRIIAVYQAADGTRFFQTQGASNPSPDATFIREDFVVGKYLSTPNWLMDVFSFCSSPKGMIILVILPLSILIFFQLLEIFEIINALLLEKKVIQLEIRYDHQDNYKNNIGYEMRYADQIYFYDVVPVEDKQPVQDFLWGNLYQSTKKSERKKNNIVNKALEYYPTDREKYWQHFLNHAKTYREKKLIKKRQELAKTVKAGQEKNNAIKNYEKLKFTEDFIKAENLKKKADLKKQEKDLKKQKNKVETKQSLQLINEKTNNKNPFVMLYEDFVKDFNKIMQKTKDYFNKNK